MAYLKKCLRICCLGTTGPFVTDCIKGYIKKTTDKLPELLTVSCIILYKGRDINLVIVTIVDTGALYVNVHSKIGVLSRKA